MKLSTLLTTLLSGRIFYSLTEFDSRVTVDVDFLLRQMPNTPEQLRVVLEEIIAACDITLTREEWYELYLAAGHLLP